MFTFILYIILALVFSYFATQNTQPVTISLLGANLTSIPLYVVLVVTLIVGLAFSWFIGLFDSIGATMKIRGKEHVIQDGKDKIGELKKEINQLKEENARLSGELKKTNNHIA
jgi:uncharacterized integral membrane protein